MSHQTYNHNFESEVGYTPSDIAIELLEQNDEQYPFAFIVLPEEQVSLDALKDLCQLSIEPGLSWDTFTDIEPADAPYIAYAQVGTKNLGVSPNQAVVNLDLERGELGMTIRDALWFLVQHPSYEPENTIDLLGARYKEVFVPSLYKNNDAWILSAIHMDIAERQCGGASKYVRAF